MPALYDISRAAAGMLGSGRIADATAERLRDLFQVDGAAVWLWDEQRNDLVALASAVPNSALPDRRLQAGQGLCGRAFVTGRLEVEEDYAACPEALPTSDGPGVASAMAAPLRVDGRGVGVLWVETVERRSFAPEDREALAHVAEQLAPVLEAMRLRAQLQRRRMEAEALADLARKGVGSRDVAQMLSLLSEHAARLLGADYALVTAVDDRYNVGLRGSFGARRTTPEGRTLSPQGIGQAVLRAGKTLVLEEGDQATCELLLCSPTHSAEGARAVLATPVPSREDLRGALIAGWRSAYHPGPDDVRIIETLAAFGASMIDNARSQQQSQQLAAQLKAIIDQMPSGVVVVDPAGSMTVLNSAGREIAGLPADSPFATGVRLESPEMRQAFEASHLDFATTALGRALAGERVQSHEYSARTPDGREVWLRASASPLVDSAGTSAGAISVFTDVTEAKLASERRNRALERRLALAAIADALGDAGRSTEAMLRITCRELSNVLGATCVIRMLVDGQLVIVRGSVHDDDPKRHALMNSLLDAQPLTAGAGRHGAVMDSGKPMRWFDSGGRRLGKQARSPAVRKMLTGTPVYAMLVAPLQAHGAKLGTIGLYRYDRAEPFSEEDEAFVVDVGVRAGLVLENARLFEQLAASRARLEELSQRMVQLAERERRGLALELHDEIGQGLTAARLLLEAARRLPARLRDERLDEACKTLDEAVAQVRGLSLDLRPPMLDRFGLVAALDGYLERYSHRTGIKVTCRAGGLVARPALEVEMAAYRIIQEGLTNVARHSGVRRADIALWSDDQSLWVEVSDQGQGFDPALLEWEPSTGLTGMQERAELLGGQLTIDAAPAAGTRLLARFPLTL